MRRTARGLLPPLRSRGGLGWGALKMDQDGVHHELRRLDDFVIPESKHMVPARLQVIRAALVAFELLDVLSTIELDGQPAFHAREVHDVRSNRQLAPELVPGQPAEPQVLPQEPFAIGRSIAQVASIDPLAFHEEDPTPTLPCVAGEGEECGAEVEPAIGDCRVDA